MTLGSYTNTLHCLATWHYHTRNLTHGNLKILKKFKTSEKKQRLTCGTL